MDISGSNGPLVTFSFESRILPGLPLSALQRMVVRASEFNARMDLTGSLRLEGGWFHEIVEGRPEIILPLAGRIVADRRHEAIRVKFFGRCEVRAFENWTVEGFGDVAPLVDFVETASNVRVLAPRTPSRIAGTGRLGNPVLTGLS